MAATERSPLAAFGQAYGQGRFASGNPGVSFDDTGRVQPFSGQPVVTTSTTTSGPQINGGVFPPRPSFFWRSNEATPTVQTNQLRTRWNFLPWNRTTPPAPVPTYGLTTATPIVTRTRQVREPLTTTTTVTENRRVITAPPAVTDTLVIEEMKVYNEAPLWWWLFIVDGILMIILGVLQMLFCIENFYYGHFWTGVMLILFGIFGAIHRGDYLHKWKTIVYIIVGIFTSAAVYACLTFDLEIFCHQIIEASQFGSNNAYIGVEKFRYAYLTISPDIIINGDLQWNIWICFGLYGLQMFLLIIGFLVLTSMLYVIDRFYNSHFVITKKVEPFCHPNIFNPWGQASLGQAQIFIGAVLNASIFGNNVVLWQQMFAPVWAGILPILAGVFAALSLKSCGLKHRCVDYSAIILELISAIISIVAIILVCIGMIQNIQSLQLSVIMTYTTFSQQLMVASSLIFCISLLACLANVFYSVALLIRLITCICCSKRETSLENIQYIYDDSALEPLTPAATYEKKIRYVTDADANVAPAVYYGYGAGLGIGGKRLARTNVTNSFDDQYEVRGVRGVEGGGAVGRDVRTPYLAAL